MVNVPSGVRVCSLDVNTEVDVPTIGSEMIVAEAAGDIVLSAT